MTSLVVTVTSLLPLYLALPLSASPDIPPSPSPDQSDHVDIFTYLLHPLAQLAAYDTGSSSDSFSSDRTLSSSSTSSVSLRSKVKFLAALSYLRQILLERGVVEVEVSDALSGLLHMWRHAGRAAGIENRYPAAEKRSDYGLSVRRTRYTSLGSPILKSTSYKTNTGSENLFRYGRSLKNV